MQKWGAWASLWRDSGDTDSQRLIRETNMPVRRAASRELVIHSSSGGSRAWSTALGVWGRVVPALVAMTIQQMMPHVGGDAGLRTNPTGGGDVAGGNFWCKHSQIKYTHYLGQTHAGPWEDTYENPGCCAGRAEGHLGLHPLGNALYMSLISHQSRETGTIFPVLQMNGLKVVRLSNLVKVILRFQFQFCQTPKSVYLSTRPPPSWQEIRGGTEIPSFPSPLLFLPSCILSFFLSR